VVLRVRCLGAPEVYLTRGDTRGQRSSHPATSSEVKGIDAEISDRGFCRKLDQAAVAKLQAATSMKVHFSIPQAPNSCTRYYTMRLTIPKKVFGQTVWFQSDSRFGPGS